ncbi:MAG: ParB/RepB/Spo0J family partition protein [Holosporales bacterium]|jgi:ParB family chromosome partitioning protein|nr:ParB/RepB/Spo0J family partition protein [Holosporales bacterium]
MDSKLGRGLSALFGDAQSDPLENSNLVISKLSTKLIFPNENQPRKLFDEEKIRELADSISRHGIIQPLAVKKKGKIYQIVAGERRWRASKLIGLEELPVHVLNCETSEALLLALTENLQRADLNPIEEADAMKMIMLSCECRQDDLSVMLCKSRSYIANALRLLSLPERIRDLIKIGRLTAGHGKCLAGVRNAEEIAGLAVERGWNVRQLEGSMKDLKVGNFASVEDVFAREIKTEAGTPIDIQANPDAMEIAIKVAEALKIKTRLRLTRKGGVFTLTCRSCEELEELVEKFTSLSDKE